MQPLKLFATFLFFLLLALTGRPEALLASACDVGGENETQDQLEARLKICEAEIAEQSVLVNNKAREATTIERDIAILKAKIDKARLEINKRNVNIKQLDGGIEVHKREIGTLEQKVGRMQESLAKLMRETRATRDVPAYHFLLSDQTLSSFFLDFDQFVALEGSLRDLFGSIKVAKAQTEGEKSALEVKKRKEAELKAVQEIERQKTQSLQNERDRILKLTKGEEAKYKEVLAEKQRIAAQIKNRIITLTGGGELKFGDALQLARIPEAQTGVRAAFLLAILTQESGLDGVIGRNLGRCFYNTPWSTPTGTVMSSRQKPSFLALMKELGLNPDTTPVSCPISRDGTYGGAMGPSQFMPTTWWDIESETGYKRRVQNITGRPPSPFDNLSAFTGTSLYLSDGLVGCRKTYQTQYSQEACAAAKYYAGGNWSRYLTRYGNPVVDRAIDFQEDIDFLDSQT
ncbi:MAG: hypothetical protein COV10_00585 [Candidatus Vogelbacteria bacterium CG10_big_fil_rev_8_21_14_0_10_51_16]|uniref:Transglycosylase SLT domain-containing protein n=1 Tax=Candidatus Vogelbacteria bacterium CG10_big_fil_rev_8_21_14_0_10_51_16 TaxID=1975045 RepID=A0A2H0RFB7_9BACT|nr:MAG: hypothetical protein COV10_00585 [Candidatus Vogelbacteria bacterium CG10_big_fil_rev_8_21_14_0_10_51_16]